MITKIKRDWRDKPNVKILVESEIFDRRLDKFRTMTRQVRYTILESGEKGRTSLVSKTGQSSLPNQVLWFWLDRPLIKNSDTWEFSLKSQHNLLDGKQVLPIHASLNLIRWFNLRKGYSRNLIQEYEIYGLERHLFTNG
jgi:hypothetical protein